MHIATIARAGFKPSAPWPPRESENSRSFRRRAISSENTDMFRLEIKLARHGMRVLEAVILHRRRRVRESDWPPRSRPRRVWHRTSLPPAPPRLHRDFTATSPLRPAPSTFQPSSRPVAPWSAAEFAPNRPAASARPQRGASARPGSPRAVVCVVRPPPCLPSRIYPVVLTLSVV